MGVHRAMTMAASAAVFLDRDGVINEVIVRNGRPYSPGTLADMRVCVGVPDALAALRAAGYLLIVVTNQPDVGHGRQRLETVVAMHEYLLANLPLDDVRVCYHTDADACECRKPKPGMLLDAAKAWEVDLRASYMIGDRWRDIDAGRAAGCRTILVGDGYAERPAQGFDLKADSLLDATRLILNLEAAMTEASRARGSLDEVPARDRV